MFCLLLLRFARLKSMCVCKYIRKDRINFKFFLELDLNCYRLPQSIAAEPHRSSLNHADFFT